MDFLAIEKIVMGGGPAVKSTRIASPENNVFRHYSDHLSSRSRSACQSLGNCPFPENFSGERKKFKFVGIEICSIPCVGISTPEPNFCPEDAQTMVRGRSLLWKGLRFTASSLSNFAPEQLPAPAVTVPD